MNPTKSHRLSSASAWLAALAMCVLCPAWSHAAPQFHEFIDPNPNPGNQFGATVVPLSTGNVVITSPFDDAGGEDAGAVYLFNGATGALISTLTGSAGDTVGSDGVVALSNGNYVVRSPAWDNGDVVDAGAVTWCSGSNGLNGLVTSDNSLVGSTQDDRVGNSHFGHVIALSNGNYVVGNFEWDNADMVDAGSVTWCSGTSGRSGIISMFNSLVGNSEFNGVGLEVMALSNGNYVTSDGSRVTWGNGTSGVTGHVSSGNSLVSDSGATVTVLSNGNYVVSDPYWNGDGLVEAGAVVWCSGSAGRSGFMTSANSLVGTTDDDRVGTFVTALSNGNYVVCSPSWDNPDSPEYVEPEVNAGAVTWCSGGGGVIGPITSSNSLVGRNYTSGPFKGDELGYGGVKALSNGNYVVCSPFLDFYNAEVLQVMEDAGAVTWCSGSLGRTGFVTGDNSLVGGWPSYLVGNAVTALKNGNYVVQSTYTPDNNVTTYPAVTVCSGTTGMSGLVTSDNSLYGNVLSSNVTPLSNGNFVVSDPNWDNGSEENVGAVRWCSGSAGTNGPVSSSSALVGSSADDQVGARVTALSNGSYVVSSPHWDRNGVQNAGAVTWCSGSGGRSGPVSSSNSLVGTVINDLVGGSSFGFGGGINGVAALSNGNYVVSSPEVYYHDLSGAGAATWGSGTSGVSGPVSASNSLIGLTTQTHINGVVEDAGNSTYIISFLHEDDASGKVRVGSLVDGAAVQSPTVTAISPSSGSPDGGTSVTIKGTNFIGTPGVTIGGTAATEVDVVNSSTLTCTTPAHAAGTVSVMVTTTLGTNGANNLYTYGNPAPILFGIFPIMGSTAGGTPVTISGENFTGATGVTIGGIAATNVSVVNDTTITCTTPAHAEGEASVLVTTSIGTNAANSFYLYVIPIPTVTAISPNTGSTEGGTSVTLTGTYFTGATGVTFNGAGATHVNVVNDTTLTCRTPARPAGSASVRVSNPHGANDANTLYTYVTPPTVTAVTPAIGSIEGGASVTITGANLTGATSVTFDGTAATSVVVVNSTTITCIIPAHAAGPVSVVVTTPGGPNAPNALFTYVPPVPDIAVAQGGPLTDGVSTVPHGRLPVGSSSEPLTFTITNPGTAELTSLAVSKSGPHAADFTVSALSATSIPVGTGTATFTVTFTPSSGGARSAALHITSNVNSVKNPFDIGLSGSGSVTGKSAQVIAFTPPARVYLAESPLTLTASASSGLPVTFSLVSGAATLSGNVLTFIAKGPVKVRASQDGDDSYLPATAVERTITAAANPTTLTLSNLSQTYTGMARPITVLGTGGAVVVTYKVGANFVPDAPINAGSYAVKVVAGSTTKTGTLVITKAPLFVQPDDQRRLVGQENPALGFSYSGFLGSDNAANSVSKAPVITTTAKVSSPGGLYPITASGGTSANYLFVYLAGTMKIETFAASYEALLMDAGTPRRPAAKLEMTVAATSMTFSAKLTTPTETAALSLPGKLTIDTLTETATGIATVKKGTNIFLVEVTLPLTGDFQAEATYKGNLLGDTTNGRKLLTLAKGQTLSYIGTHSALLAPAAAAAGVPAGAGWAVATIDAKGMLKLVGKLADGTGLTASLAADGSSDPGYRLFLQPYTPARTGAFIAGAFALKPQLDEGLAGRRYVAFEDAADFTWEKAPRLLDTSYRAGFGPVDTRLTLDPWLPPAAAKTGVPAITLAQRLGLTANQFTAEHSNISSASFVHLPTTLALSATNVVSVIAPANTTKWKVTITPATGAFVGSFELMDTGKKRSVPFTGMMRQPPSTDSSGLIGDGSFQLPSLLPAPDNEILSGEVGFER